MMKSFQLSKPFCVFILLLSLMSSCTQDSGKATQEASEQSEKEQPEPQNVEKESVVPEEEPEAVLKEEIPAVNGDTDTTVIQKIAAYIREVHLKGNARHLDEKDREFQYEKVDLNGDEKPEYLVGLQSTYFCGSGGCKFLLFDHQVRLINKFTVMRGPVYVSDQAKNGWRVLIVYNNGAYRNLEFKDGEYPRNPSMAPETDYYISTKMRVLFPDEVELPSHRF